MQFGIGTIGKMDGHFDDGGRSTLVWCNVINNIILFSLPFIQFFSLLLPLLLFLFVICVFFHFYVVVSVVFFLPTCTQSLFLPLSFVVISFQNVYAKAIYDNIAESPDELAFKVGTCVALSSLLLLRLILLQ